MSGVKRWEPENAALGYNIRPGDGGSFVLTSDYDRDAGALSAQVNTLTGWYSNALDTCRALEVERDTLRAQVEAMRALLTDARRYVDKSWPDGVHSYRTNSVSGDLLGKIDAALQAKP